MKKQTTTNTPNEVEFNFDHFLYAAKNIRIVQKDESSKEELHHTDSQTSDMNHSEQQELHEKENIDQLSAKRKEMLYRLLADTYSPSASPNEVKKPKKPRRKPNTCSSAVHLDKQQILVALNDMVLDTVKLLMDTEIKPLIKEQFKEQASVIHTDTVKIHHHYLEKICAYINNASPVHEDDLLFDEDIMRIFKISKATLERHRHELQPQKMLGRWVYHKQIVLEHRNRFIK